MAASGRRSDRPESADVGQAGSGHAARALVAAGLFGDLGVLRGNLDHGDIRRVVVLHCVLLNVLVLWTSCYSQSSHFKDLMTFDSIGS